MPTFRKKAVEVEALKFDGGNVTECELFCGGAAGQATYDGKELYIKTLEGRMHVSKGDWIIRGVQGEFYPCKPDIFDQTYEPVVPGTELVASILDL